MALDWCVHPFLASWKDVSWNVGMEGDGTKGVIDVSENGVRKRVVSSRKRALDETKLLLLD